MKLVACNKIIIGKKYFTKIGKFMDLIIVIEQIGIKYRVRNADTNRILPKLRNKNELLKRVNY